MKNLLLESLMASLIVVQPVIAKSEMAYHAVQPMAGPCGGGMCANTCSGGCSGSCTRSCQGRNR